MAEESAVKVCVRVRPLIEREGVATTESSEQVQLYWKAEKQSIQQIDDGNATKTFAFDRVFSADETTYQLYQGIAKPLVVSSVEGYNGTIFAYGQTSSGKTFTMMGSDLIPGVIPLAMEEVFQSIKTFPKKEFLLRVSYMEIYNETVTDLLVDSWKRKPLEIRETISKNIFVADLTEELVTSPSQALAWIRKGEKNRHYGKTKMNERSSRSHTIFRMILESRDRSDPASGENSDGAIFVSHLNLVDLAGSERASQTGAEGTRLKEGCNINRSLFILGQVIKKLSDESQRGFTNYRDSKLTRILQNSLGGNAKTLVIATITPATLDETLSTLQFASTAKKMKNDPHVTEVSDDGALLKRYRNEIVDLKRRLNEVSSVTQTTVTEKESLSQLLQEKDQLQREQQDRIRNLTKLLVTSSNLFLGKKMPKRRVTWGGGKLLRLAQASEEAADNTDLSFAESITRKRKADHSCITELCEDDEDFDSRWEIPDESTFDMDMNLRNVTLRSFGDSPKDAVSPHNTHELSEKVSSLEVQLERETRQKEEARATLEALNERVVELGHQLDAEGQQKQQAVESVAALELRVADLEKMLQEQTQESRETEKMRMEFAETIRLCETLVSEKEMVAAEREYFKQELGIFIEESNSLEKEKSALMQELEEHKELDEFKRLEEDCMKENVQELQNEIASLKKALESSELKCREFDVKLGAMSEELKNQSEWADGLHSMSEKDLAQQVSQLRRSLDDAEGLSRDTRKEWAVLRSHNMALKERDVEQTARYDEMEAEVSRLRSQLEAEKCRYRKMQADLQKELNVAFDENTKLTTLLDGKVPKHLVDGVTLERRVGDLNKELAECQESEEALRVQLHELEALKALPDKVNDLTNQVCQLSEELRMAQSQRDGLLSAQAASQQEAQQLHASLKAELSAAQLREHDLTQRCAHVTEQADSLRAHLDDSGKERSQLLATAEQANLDESDRQRSALEESLHDMQLTIKDLEERLADSEQSRSAEEEIGKELQYQLNQLTEELERVQAERERLLAEVSSAQSSMEKLLSTVTSLTEEIDQHKMALKENLDKLNKLAVTLESVQAERDHLLSDQMASPLSAPEDLEKMLNTVTSLTEERDQLKLDMQENVEMMIENQEELRTALDRIHEQKKMIRRLKASQTSNQDGPTMEELEELQNKVSLCEELESVQAERDLSERAASAQSSAEDLEKLMSTVASLTEERDQLQQILEDLRQKNQLRADLEDKEGMVAHLQNELNQQHAANSEVHARDEHAEQLHIILQTPVEQKTQLKVDLRSSVEKVCSSELERHSAEKQSHVEKQVSFCEELESAQAERDLSERAASAQSSAEDLEKLMSTVVSLTEERDQLQQILEDLRQEKNQLRADLEDKEGMIQTELQQQHPLALKEEQASQLLLQIKQLEEQLEGLAEERHQLKSDLEENVEMMIQNQDELRHAQENIRILNEELYLLKTQKDKLENKTERDPPSDQLEALQKKVEQMTVELDKVGAERENLQSEDLDSAQRSTEELENLVFKVKSLTEERDHLQEILEGLKREKIQLNLNLEGKQEMVEQLQSSLQTFTEQNSQLESDLQQHMQMAATTQDLLHSIQEALSEQKQVNSDLEKCCRDKESLLEQETKALTEELESVQAERDHLLAEKVPHSATTPEDLEKLMSTVASLTGERDQLQQILEGLRQEKNQLRADLEDQLETVMATKDLLQSIQEQLNEQKQVNSDLGKCCRDKESLLEQETKALTEKLESVQAERDHLLAEKVPPSASAPEDLEKLMSTVASLTEERDQLQQILEDLRQEKNQLRADLEDKEGMVMATKDLLQSIQEQLNEQKQLNSDLEKCCRDKESLLEQEIKDLTMSLEGVQAERDSLMREKAASTVSSSEDLEKLVSTVTSLTKERDQLQQILEDLRQEKNQLKADLEDKEGMICAVEHKLKEQEDINREQKTAREQDEARLQQEIQQLKTERTHLGEERSRLQRDLQENMEMVIQVQVSLKQQQDLNDQQQREREQQETHFKHQVQQLERELHILRERQLTAKADVDSCNQRLIEANKTISALQEPLGRLDQSSTHVDKAGGLWPKIHDSTLQLQEAFNRFKVFMDCCNTALSPLYRAKEVQKSLLIGLNHPIFTRFAFSQLSCQTMPHKKKGLLIIYADHYMDRFELLVQNDLAVFEERRLQDVLLCRAQAPSFSLKEADLQGRLSELLEKRQGYIQKMTSIQERLTANMACDPSELSDELRDMAMFTEQLEAVCSSQPLDTTALDNILSCEVSRRAALMRGKEMSWQAIVNELGDFSSELEQLIGQSQAQLNEERSKSSTLLQGLEDSPFSMYTEQLDLELQQAKEEAKAMRVHIQKLEEVQITARERVSNHKRATQLLQTELQDACAQVEEKENTIHTLKTKLRESEAFSQKNTSPSAVELERIQATVVNLEVQLTSASTQHEEEIKKMTALLIVKEDSLRKLKEALRKSQQHGEESFLQGEDLFAKLTNPKGCVVQSSVSMGKSKLQDEVKMLNLQITELESTVTNQQADIAKWKSRAFKLKEKSRLVLDKPDSSPYTPTKKRPQITSSSSQFLSPKRVRGIREVLASPNKMMEPPKMVLESSKIPLLESPKSRFFDAPGFKSISRDCPTQFFDNSNLGTIPEAAIVPTRTYDYFAEDEARSMEKQEEWWPLSPEKADMCKNQ